MSQHGKNYRQARSQIDREQLYSPVEAVKLLKGSETAKFDESVEAHFNLGLNVRHAEQQLRGTLMLPHGTGRQLRVAVFAEGEKAREAEEAGADVVGSADLAKRARHVLAVKRHGPRRPLHADRPARGADPRSPGTGGAGGPSGTARSPRPHERPAGREDPDPRTARGSPARGRARSLIRRAAGMCDRSTPRPIASARMTI